MSVISKGASNLAYAMRQRFVCCHYVWPDCPDEFLFGYKAISVLDEVTQDLEAL